MATIFIPVEVPDSELVKYLGGDYPIGAKVTVGGIEFTKHSESPFPTQPATAPGFVRTESEFGYQTAPAPQPADPWASQPATGGAPPAAQYPQGPTPAAGAAQPMPQTGSPRCVHGEMRFVAAGFSKSTGKPYKAFFGCPAPRGQQQCKSVPAMS